MQNKQKIESGVTPKQFKDVVAHFATGVTLVTTLNAQGEPAGLIVNSLSSVSLDPPLILFCLAKKSQLHPVFEAQERFAVNLLSTDQKWVIDQFTTPVDDRWSEVAYTTETGVPFLQDNLATIECSVAARHDAGDHTIYVGAVTQMTEGEGQPLLYYNRQFGGFSSVF